MDGHLFCKLICNFRGFQSTRHVAFVFFNLALTSFSLAEHSSNVCQSQSYLIYLPCITICHECCSLGLLFLYSVCSVQRRPTVPSGCSRNSCHSFACDCSVCLLLVSVWGFVKLSTWSANTHRIILVSEETAWRRMRKKNLYSRV